MDIDRVTERSRRKLLAVVRIASSDLAARVVRDTPVVTGQLQSAWVARLNVPLGDRRLPISTDRNPTIYTAQVTIQSMGEGDDLFFLNSEPYAKRIENGGSIQRPAGMLHVNLNDWQSIVDRATNIARTQVK